MASYICAVGRAALNLTAAAAEACDVGTHNRLIGVHVPPVLRRPANVHAMSRQTYKGKA